MTATWAPPLSLLPKVAPARFVNWFNMSTADVSDAQFKAILVALNVQAPQVAAAWGPKALLRHYYGVDPAKVPAGHVKAYLLPNLDVANALGYHDVDPQGDPYVRVGTRACLEHGGTVLQGPISISACASHEACELAADPNCDQWATTNTFGTSVAVETADPVEGYAYNIHLGDGQLVAVSDFVFPAWFDMNNVAGPFDQMRVTTAPQRMAKGGYEITRDASGEHETFAATYAEAFPAWRAESQSWPTSRTARRLRNA